jgi:uncharacterized protein involved in exopolysaccharide biosynthesis
MTKDTHTTEVSENVGEFPNIESLASEHDRISREIDELPLTCAAEEQRRRLNDSLWAIRALIAATPSKTQAELQAKTRIFQVEAARDGEFECHVPGSARDLSRSVAADVMAMQIAA